MYPAPGSLTGVTYLKMLCSHNMLLIYITNELIQWRQKYWPIQDYFDTILQCWKITAEVVQIELYESMCTCMCVYVCFSLCVCKDRERENDEGGMEGIFTNFWSIKIHQIKVLMWFMILLRRCKCFFFFEKKNHSDEQKGAWNSLFFLILSKQNYNFGTKEEQFQW